MVRFENLWKNHPGKGVFPCNKAVHQNQCAIRMSVTLDKSGVDISSFSGVKCWERHEDEFRHILRAQELADWIDKHPEIFGNAVKLSRKKFPKMNSKSFRHTGIVFIKDGWLGGVDHIDLWNGIELKAGTNDYFEKGVEIWFWVLI